MGQFSIINKEDHKIDAIPLIPFHAQRRLEAWRFCVGGERFFLKAGGFDLLLPDANISEECCHYQC
jgi:hypothetical protein